ncbi:hypothetical protein [Natronincola ferrireducens]|uniref:Uncharacterized protein n=1 Tax=Natronincola ferrireducens TaxID=393762 RepID=A0A1G9EJV2_9FIRM|nr:hypothetical protein [Natronincola ferrireducens]SDK76311.1 hypothetical protein SAMN05660472_01997 [Natronincola ferrireducens]
MRKLQFRYPIMVFLKCSCSNQIPITEIQIRRELNTKLFLSYRLGCSICQHEIRQTLYLTTEETDLTDFMNVFKVIPSIKDELAIIKLDCVKGKVKDGNPYFYGSYSHLRFWDKVIQRDIIKIPYIIEE